MQEGRSKRRGYGDIVALRYVTTDGRIEMCWPCRIVEDSDDLLALFIAAGSPYKAGPKLSAREKRTSNRGYLPPDEHVWRHDTLRLMPPGRMHSVSMFFAENAGQHRLLKYFVNMEEPFRRTEVGFDTQDHTLDIEVQPDLTWKWRDETELEHHVEEGFYTPELAESARREGQDAIAAILRREHVCMRGWEGWTPDPAWSVPSFAAGWDSGPLTQWTRRQWAYGST